MTECEINLTASGTYSPDNLSLKYHWKFGKNIEQNKKNPRAVTLETGEHIIRLDVADSKNNSTFHEIRVTVPAEDITIEEEEKEEKKPTKNTEKSENEKITNIITKEDFAEMEIILQNPEKFTQTKN